MESVKLAKVCGLCAGCSFAISSALDAKQKHESVTIFKELTHNKTVIRKLSEAGIKVAENLSELALGTVVIIRAHGEPPETYKFLNDNNFFYIDCTCKNVKDIHEKVKKFSGCGYQVLIIGKYGKKNGKLHPEVAGTIGWCEGNVILVEDEEDLTKVENTEHKKIYLVCQTTFNFQKAENLIDKIKQICNKKNIELVVNNSICSAQKVINESSAELAKACDLMFVVGGKNSSNTKELFENMKKITTSIFLENIFDWEKELKKLNFQISPSTKIGITAGASTLKEELFSLKNLIEEKLRKK